MNFNQFSIIFGILAEYFGAQPSKGLTKIYYESFKKWREEEFKRACEIVMRSRVYNGLPKIADIVEAIQGKPEDKAALAYHALVDAMKRVGSWETVLFEDGAISRAVEAMGGWEYVNGIGEDEWKFRRKEFESLYLAHMRRGDNQPQKCFGTFDRINGSNSQDGWNKPVLIQDATRAQVVEKPGMLDFLGKRSDAKA